MACDAFDGVAQAFGEPRNAFGVGFGENGRDKTEAVARETGLQLCDNKCLGSAVSATETLAR
ncbi:MAG: hypothetical protein JWN98_1016 [Abditibacteriota bacterium]|nr:hypothetical protein [Abditibacteriota bacterium]